MIPSKRYVVTEESPCEVCEGSGYVRELGVLCSGCGPTGMIRNEVSLLSVLKSFWKELEDEALCRYQVGQ
jgi:hypothetical protein